MSVRLARSMLAQTILLSLIFLCSGVYLLAVRPVLDHTDPDIDPREATLTQATYRFDALLAAPRPPKEIERTIVRDPFVVDLTRRNPGFRYAALVGGTWIGTGEPVRYREFGLQGMTAARARAASGVCVRMERVVRSRGRGFVRYLNCGMPRYFELSGIVHPVPIGRPGPLRIYGDLIWRNSRQFLLPSLGVFLLCATILAINIGMIRRMAGLIGPRDEADGRIHPLPETGLPAEVLPLVRAVNGMIAEVTAVEERQRFFLSAAAHEMRTPLTVLRTRLELLDDGEAKDKLVSDVRRLTRLVNELLTLMSVRVRTAVSDAVDLAACCGRVIAALDPVATARGVRLDLAVMDPAVRIAGDAGLVEVAITNLVDNAIAFAPSGTAVMIAIDAEGGVTVRDHGKGIPDGQARNLFEPFVRFSKNYRGYGLGLTIVKSVADLHGATVSATNAPGGGACFTLRFSRITPV
ncbi:HAMP domain-containing sensor histidine kinase [Sphingomonas sp. 2R-10]|uniref:sensor histidine kinase n=1 Tax=Sphingomonas sp. 2R-10 TaxID=3045148 RepID=UPI000F7AFEFF|nr:HAMP domain-containing sensor histidine kinase [Sphingomonas sp. 2R-10]MDJ0276425.1 HAMP domain-containing sensor histidine kinase [Sphingomonas sp. 2R-10]